MRISITTIKTMRLASLIIGGIALFVVTYLFLVLPGYLEGIDWVQNFRPSVLLLLDGRSPYETNTVFNPPYVFVPMLVLALLPVGISTTAMILLPIFGYAFAAYRLKVSLENFLIFLLNPALYYNMIVANIDWLIPLGATLPPRIGLFFVLAKPQIGGAVALIWLIDAYRTGGVKAVIKTFWPVTAAISLSFVVFGLWPLHAVSLPEIWWNLSPWPYAIPIGLALLVLAIRRNDKLLSLSVGAMLSPYLAPPSWAVPVFGTIKDRWLLIAAVVGTWLVWLVLKS